MSRSFFATVAIATMLLLTGCAGESNGAAIDSTDNKPQPAVVNDVKRTDGVNALKCRDGLMAVDVPLGSHQELDGASFQLTQEATPDYKEDLIQTSATLTVKLNNKSALPALIVHSFKGKDLSCTGGPLNDKSLNVTVGKGGTGSFVLPTSAYTEYPTLGDSIAGVTLCLDLSQS